MLLLRPIVIETAFIVRNSLIRLLLERFLKT